MKNSEKLNSKALTCICKAAAAFALGIAATAWIYSATIQSPTLGLTALVSALVAFAVFLFEFNNFSILSTLAVQAEAIERLENEIKL